MRSLKDQMEKNEQRLQREAERKKREFDRQNESLRQANLRIDRQLIESEANVRAMDWKLREQMSMYEREKDRLLAVIRSKSVPPPDINITLCVIQ